jgi:hypothetical protein
LQQTRDRAVPIGEFDDLAIGYYITEDGILMRKWRPYDVPTNEEWHAYHQIVVPQKHRKEILSMAHDVPMSGHLGVNKTCELARENLGETQNIMKDTFDRKAQQRTFVVGDKVLVLFPVLGKPLQAKFSGPYEVVKQINTWNYVVKTPDRRKKTQICHINMLKKYYERGDRIPAVAVVAVDDPDDPDDDGDTDDDLGVSEFVQGEAGVCAKLKNSVVLDNLDGKLSHLTPEQREPLKQLIFEYQDICSDIPSRTHLLEHDVDVGDAQPIKQAPYRASPEKRESMRKEVVYLIENNFAGNDKYSDWRMKNKNQRIMRWALTVQEYCLKISHIKGKDNVIADALSRSM